MHSDEVRGDPPAPDDGASFAARRLLRRAGIVPIEPDAAVAVMLEPGERVLAARHAAEVAGPGDDSSGLLLGDLYLTDRRLIHLARTPVSVPLDVIREAEVISQWLLLRVGSADGIRIRVADPGALRTQIGVARAARQPGPGDGALG